MGLAIAIPVYNNVTFFESCLRSLQEQSNKDFDVHVFDDNSTQNYTSAIEGFSELKITYHRNEQNLGALQNMQHSYNRLCKDYDFVMVMHEDDMLHKKYVEAFYEAIKKNTAALFITDFNEFGSEVALDKNEYYNAEELSFRSINKKELCLLFLEGHPVSFGSAIFNTKIYTGMNLDFARFEEFADRPYLLNCLNDDSIICVLSKPGYFARSHFISDSRWKKLQPQHVFNLLQLYRHILVESKFLSAGSFKKNATAFVFESYKNLALAKSAPSFIVYLSKAGRNNLSLKYSLLRNSYINRFGTRLKKIVQ